MRISDLHDGMTIYLDGGFTCAPAGPTTMRHDEGGWWFPCTGGDTYAPGAELCEHHYIEINEREDGTLIGMSLTPFEKV